MMNGSITPVVA